MDFIPIQGVGTGCGITNSRKIVTGAVLAVIQHFWGSDWLNDKTISDMKMEPRWRDKIRGMR